MKQSQSLLLLRVRLSWLLALTLVPHVILRAEEEPSAATASVLIEHTVSNSCYQLAVSCSPAAVRATLHDQVLGTRLADGPYLYHAVRRTAEGVQVCNRLEKASASVNGRVLTVRGLLAGLNVEHTFTLSADQPTMEERIVLRNDSDTMIALTDFEAGFQRRVTDRTGEVLPEFRKDRWVAVPLRARATDPKGLRMISRSRTS